VQVKITRVQLQRVISLSFAIGYTVPRTGFSGGFHDDNMVFLKRSLKVSVFNLVSPSQKSERVKALQYIGYDAV
jgi:hypothetical protein